MASQVPSQYTVKVGNVSLKATERDIYDFFAFSGEISSIHTQPAGPEAPGTQEAFVTFLDERSLETALLLTGAVIADKPVTVELAEGYVPPASSAAGAYATAAHGVPKGSEETLKKAEGMMAGLLARGYILGKDAMEKAKALDEQHALSATAKVHASALSRNAAEIDSKYAISKKLAETTATVTKSLATVDEKYQVSSKTRVALSAAEASISEAGQYMMQNKYVSSGASWLKGAFGQFKTIVADVQQQTAEKVHKAEGEGRGGAHDVDEETAVKKVEALGLSDHGPPVPAAAPAPQPGSLLDAPAPALSPASQGESAVGKSGGSSKDTPVF